MRDAITINTHVLTRNVHAEGVERDWTKAPIFMYLFAFFFYIEIYLVSRLKLFVSRNN